MTLQPTCSMCHHLAALMHMLQHTIDFVELAAAPGGYNHGCCIRILSTSIADSPRATQSCCKDPAAGGCRQDRLTLDFFRRTAFSRPLITGKRSPTVTSLSCTLLKMRRCSNRLRDTDCACASMSSTWHHSTAQHAGGDTCVSHKVRGSITAA